MDAPESKKPLFRYDIDLAQLVATLRARWQLVAGVVAGFFLLAVLYLHVVTYTYTATLLVSPVVSSSSDGLSGQLGRLGGLASLAGVSLRNNAGSASFMLYQQGLFSRDVADEMSRNPDIMRGVFRNQWDSTHNRWIRPGGPVVFVVGLIKAVLGVPNPPWRSPDGALLQEYIKANVTAELDPQRPIVTISYRNRDPQFAVLFLKELDRAVDTKLRRIALARANDYIDFLSARLEKVTNNYVRESLITTLSEQEKDQMMASATAPYAAQPFGLPSASRRPTSPRPSLVLGASLVFGALFGALAALLLPPLEGRIGRFIRRGA